MDDSEFEGEFPRGLIAQALLPYWDASGVMGEPGSRDRFWIFGPASPDNTGDTPREQAILLYALHAYRRYANSAEPNVTREILGMDIIHNFPGLEGHGIDRDMACFIFGAHNIRKTCVDVNQGNPVEAGRIGGQILLKIGQLSSSGRSTHDLEAWLRMRNCERFVAGNLNETDKDVRRLEQMSNCYDGHQRLIIPDMEQLILGVAAYVELVKLDKPAFDQGLLSGAELARQILAAKDMRYILDFPVIRQNEAFIREYKAALAHIQDTPAQRATLPPSASAQIAVPPSMARRPEPPTPEADGRVCTL